MIQFNNVTMVYEIGTRALQDVSLKIEDGEFVFLVGPSGSGKSTIVKLLTAELHPTKGSIHVNGETLFDAADAATQRERELRRKRLRFGLVFQSFNLFPQYTALKNVMLAKELLARELPDYKQNKKATLERIRQEAKDLLEQVGLAQRMGNYPWQLSGGQQQRVAIARALALKPEILCFDEPTSALDPELTGEVLRVIQSLKSSDLTMIIVTHEMAFARDVSDHIIFMDDGVIVEQGNPEDIINNPRQDRTIQFLARFK